MSKIKMPFLYRLFQVWVYALLHIFYKKVEVWGAEKFSRNAPILLVLNHQNAFMDAIAPVTLMRLSAHFLVRADVFKKKIAQWFFMQINMMPIYRVRDGYENLQKNDAIFDICYDLLGKNGIVLLFPEGNHSNRKTLRPLRKGIARIAFGAGEKTNFTLPLKIVPLGIDYSNFTDFRSNFLLNVGDPIEVSEYYSDYQKNNAKTLAQLKNKVEDAMEATMLNITDEKNYEVWKYATDNFFHEKRLSDKWKKQKEWNKKINILAAEQPEKANALASKIEEYRQRTEQLGIKDFLFDEKITFGPLVIKTLLLFLLFPIHLLGVFNNIIPFQLTNWIIGKLKDPHFHSSFKVVAGMFLFPICYLIQIGIVFLSTDLAWVEWGYVATLLPSGWFSLKYMPLHKKLLGRWRFWQLERKENKDWARARELRREINS